MSHYYYHSIWLIFVFGLRIVFSEESLVPAQQQQQNSGTLMDTQGFTLSNAYDLSALLDSNGKPTGSVKLFSGGTVGPGQSYFRGESLGQQQQQQGGIGMPQVFSSAASSFSNNTSLWLGGAFVFGAVFAFALVYGCLWFIGGSKRLLDLNDEYSKEAKDEKVKSPSRKRRATQTDEELNRLVTIVLTAVESGQCMQKSICLLGSQLGSSGSAKGLLAATLLEKMIPANIQSSIYFLTLQNALRGKTHCEKIDCATTSTAAS